MKKNKKFWIILSSCIGAVILAGGGVWLGIHRYTQKNWQQKVEADRQSSGEALLQLSKQMQEELDHEEFYDGVSVMGVSLGGMTQAEAQEAVSKQVQSQVLEQKITLTYQDQSWTYSLAELGVTVDTEGALVAAYELGRSGDWRQRKQEVAALSTSPEEIDAAVSVTDETLDAVLGVVAAEIQVDPVNATIIRSGDSFTVTPEQKGIALDVEATKTALVEAVKQEKVPETVTLTVKEIMPTRTAEALSTITDRIGSYSTYYSTSNYGREQNLIVGASKINGVVLMPGEVLSFNELVAPITVENGYHEANVILNGEYVPGLGGGLCQVSTTLYNAVIRAELGLVERDCHAYPADYVPMGLDAAVAQGYIDFKFENTSGYPVYIEMWAGGGEIGAAIYGTEIHDPSRTLSFDYVVTNVIEQPADEVTEDPSLAPGERVVTSAGHTGYEVDVYKTVTENGTSYTEYFNSSYYMASANQVKVGPAKSS